MANIQYGDMVTQLVGKSNNRVYKRNKYGFSQTVVNKPTGAATPLQQAGRQAIASLTRSWGSLTESQRSAWISAAIAPMSGFSLYVSANYDYSRFRAPLITTPVTSPTPALLVTLGSTVIASKSITWNVSALKGLFTMSVDWFGDLITTNYPLANSTDISHTYTIGTGAGCNIGIGNNSLLYRVSSNQSGYIDNVGDLTAWIIDLDLSGELLSTASVNAILQDIFNFGYSFGTLNLSSQTPAAPPSGAGITAKNNLIYRGWNVTTD